ncbi:MAG: zinc ribbon domain-containing protein [Candidatus Riflebacteria bacterium]
MDFKKARKEFDLLKNAWVTGAISLKELREAVDTTLEATKPDGTRWKIDEDTEIWLKYDDEQQCWFETALQEKEIEKTENLTVAIAPVTVSAVPAPDYQAWQESCKHKEKVEITDVPASAGSKNFCTKCGKKLKPSNKFCTDCGQKVL